jgi:DNA-directed RNA polymerase beta subunit
MPNIIDIETIQPKDMFDKVKVFINGAWVGITDKPQDLYTMLKDKKQQGIMNIYTAVFFDCKKAEIRICNDAGRLTRPLLRVKDNRLVLKKQTVEDLANNKLDWNDLLTTCRLDDAVLEYIDAEEQSWSMIAMKPNELNDLQKAADFYRYTHCEIHPSTIFGVLASCIPFPEHNQSPRNTYQCLDANESVLMKNGERVRIADVKVGDEVVTFNPDDMTMNYTTVVNQYVRPTEKKIYEITTKSARKIVATEDHKFMTNNGWKEVGELLHNKNTNNIGIYITPDEATNFLGKIETVLSEEEFRCKLNDLGIKDSLINKYTENLKELNLLPLYNNNNKLQIISRMFGFLLSDGSINVYKKGINNIVACGFDFGTSFDANNFNSDMELCGFNPTKIYEGTRHFNNTSHHTFALRYQGVFPALLIVLGVTYGKKTETTRKEIPSWILNGTPIIQREFIAGFQGGDGCKIRSNKLHKKGYNFICAETSQQINPVYKESLILFMTQCCKILQNFGIETKVNNSALIDETRVKISFKISDKQENLVKYFDKIGYRYSTTKKMDSAKIIEYIKYKNMMFVKHSKIIDKIRDLYDEKNTNTRIANLLNLKVGYISDVIRSYKNGRKISCPNLKNNTINDWNEQIQIKNECMFVPIDSIVEVENRLISDITVESDNHSFIAGNSNFLSHNCAQAKQAMGVYVTNYDSRMDKTAYVLNYPARPLVDTRIMDMIHINNIPSGFTVVVAIMTHTGYNQEDSLLFNKGSIDRGLFQATIYHTEKDEDKQKINGDEEIRCKPDATKTKGMKFANYNKVNSKGVIPENTLIQNRDVIIAKITPIKENRNDHTKVIKYEDQSRIYRTDEETYVDKNYIDRNGDGYNFAKVRIRAVRKPVIGDKFSSRSGQKGTIGNIIPEEDMPFTKDGIRPDIILNPHAIPSRMTIAQLKETILAKVLLQLGLFGDGTSFGELDVNTICEQLLKVGYEAHGNELLCNGLTGEQHECSVFTGPVFYQRLKHMVNDKQHSRSIGPMVNLTRQPAEGRSRDGGLRFGEMERDTTVAHGAARFTKERLFDVSDKYSVYTCKKCGLIASYNDAMHIHRCRTCDNRTDFAYVQIPYACKLLFQELITMNIAPRIMTEH